MLALEEIKNEKTNLKLLFVNRLFHWCVHICNLLLPLQIKFCKLRPRKKIIRLPTPVKCDDLEVGKNITRLLTWYVRKIKSAGRV